MRLFLDRSQAVNNLEIDRRDLNGALDDADEIGINAVKVDDGCVRQAEWHV